MPDATTTTAPTTTSAGGFQNFLTEGAKVPAGSAVKSLTSQTVLPEWYTNYAMGILSNQGQVGATPYQTYQGPRLADFTQTQQQGFDATKAAATAYQPGLTQATGALNQSMGMPTGTATANPYFGGAQSMVGQGTQAIGMNAATPWLNRAGNLDIVGAAQPYFNDAMTIADSSYQSGGGLAQAMPYLTAASGPTTDVSAYMDPYLGQVVDRVGDLGVRTLREKMLPEIRDRYIAAGQWNGSGQTTDTARALRDINADVLAQQSQLMSTGYQNAVQAALADKARYGQLGATAGSLGDTLMRTGLDVAGIRANIGSQMGGLTQAQMAGMSNIGSTFGQLGNQQQDALLRGATTLGNLGATAGSLANADKSQTLASAGEAARLAGLAQAYGLTGAGAISQVGALEQAFNQKNLDTAYEDYLRQQGWGQSQIDAALATLKGVAGAVPTATQEYGIVPSGVQPEYKPGTAATIAAALAGAGGLASALGAL